MRHSRVSRNLFTFVVRAGHAAAQVITMLAETVFTFPKRCRGCAGNVYVADPRNNLVERIGPDGTLTVVAGNGAQGFSGHGGPATSASLYFPIAVVLDSAGNLYIADKYNDRIRMVSGGIITTMAGNG